jgi:hypothetical protein
LIIELREISDGNNKISIFHTTQITLSRLNENRKSDKVLDGIRIFAVLVGIGVNAEGHREILGIYEGMQKDKESWLSFVQHLKSRRLSGVRPVVSDKCLGLVEAVS